MLGEIAATKAFGHPNNCYCSPCLALRAAVQDLTPAGKYAVLARRLRPAEDEMG